MPAYNEVENLRSVVEEARGALVAAAVGRAEIIVVDDGSTDGTAALADELAGRYAEVRVIHHPTNRGFSGAMTTALQGSRGDWVFLAAADGQTPIGELARFLTLRSQAEVIVGVRARRADNAFRVLLSRGFHLLARAAFALPQREFSSAFLFSGPLVRAMPIRSRPRSATVIPEVLYRARAAGARFDEIVMSHRPRLAGRSKGAGPRVILATLFELARLAVLLRLERRRPTG